ncbi:MAG TPA: hypothetical protein VFF53_07755 [Geobacteraceae bacterium]|nr:hypothetical protein [Geobacteraceae bacterium]
MKAYLFNTENGLYEGETFTEADKLVHESGLTAISPPEYERGQVPIFDRKRNAWTVMPIGVVRQLLQIRTTDTTEKQS